MSSIIVFGSFSASMVAAAAAAEMVVVFGIGPVPPLLGDRGAPEVDIRVHEPGRLLAPKGPSSVVSDVSDTRIEDSWVKPDRADGIEPPELIPLTEPTDQSGTADNLCKGAQGPTQDPPGGRNGPTGELPRNPIRPVKPTVRRIRSVVGGVGEPTHALLFLNRIAMVITR